MWPPLPLLLLLQALLLLMDISCTLLIPARPSRVMVFDWHGLLLVGGIWCHFAVGSISAAKARLEPWVLMAVPCVCMSQLAERGACPAACQAASQARAACPT